MKRAFNAVQTDIARSLKPFGLRMISYSALALVVDNSGLRQSHISTALSVERPNLVVILDDLEKTGLINRVRQTSDRRAYALIATPAGIGICAQATRALQDHEQRIFGALKGRNKDRLINIFQDIEKIAKEFDT